MSSSNDPGTAPPPTGPTREAVATVVITMVLLAAFVWWIRPPRADFKPAPLEALPEDCLKVNRAFVPSNITELPISALPQLDEPHRRRALFRLNFEACSCGCNQSIAECLANHPQCKVCPALAVTIIERVKAEK